MPSPFKFLAAIAVCLLPGVSLAAICAPVINSVPTLGEWGTIGLVVGVAYVAGRAMGGRRSKRSDQERADGDSASPGSGD